MLLPKSPQIMPPDPRRTLLSIALAVVLAATALAQTAEVTHNVNLRQDPSTDKPPIRLLKTRDESLRIVPCDV